MCKGAASDEVATEGLPVFVVEEIRDVDSHRPVVVESVVAAQVDGGVGLDVASVEPGRPAEVVDPARAQTGVQLPACVGDSPGRTCSPENSRGAAGLSDQAGLPWDRNRTMSN